jgi:hypothetical protein
VWFSCMASADHQRWRPDHLEKKKTRLPCVLMYRHALDKRVIALLRSSKWRGDSIQDTQKHSYFKAYKESLWRDCKILFWHKWLLFLITVDLHTVPSDLYWTPFHARRWCRGWAIVTAVCLPTASARWIVEQNLLSSRNKTILLCY